MKTTMLAAATACVLLAGCQSASIRSTPDGTADGVAYYLPMRLLKLHYTRTEPETEARKRLAKAKTAADAAAEALAKAKAASDQAEALRKAGAGEHAASRRLAEEADYQKALLALATRTHEAALAELESASDALLAEQAARAAAGECKLVEKIQVTPTELLPDPGHRYVAQVLHEPWRRDQVKIETTRQGLLTSSNATVVDETASILVSLFRSRAAASGGLFESFKSWKGVKPEAPACQVASVEMTLGPEELCEFNEALGKHGSGLSLRWRDEPAGGTATAPGGAAADGALLASAPTSDGFFYRRELTRLLEVRDAGVVGTSTQCRDAGGQKTSAVPGALLTTIPVALPNHSALERIRIDATTFATNVNKLTFENGLLTSADTDQPSQLLGVAKLPTDIVAGVLESVTGLVQLRINLGQQDVARADQERALACALDRLRAAQEGTEPSLPASACP